MPRQAGIFSPKNIPNNTLGFGFGYNNFDSVLTPQTQQQRSLAGQLGTTTQATKNTLFTIDTMSQGLSQNLHMVQNQPGQQPANVAQGQPKQSLSSQLVQSLKP